jgi:DNA segregation ATPase FtsK/SpoIIIE-like protein
MLFNPPGEVSLERIQGAYVSDPEFTKVIDEVAAQRPQTFDDGLFARVNATAENDTPKGRRTKGKNEKWSRGKNEPGGSSEGDVIEIHLVLPEDMRHRVLLYQHVQHTVDADVCDDDGTTSANLVRVIDTGEGRHVAEANNPILIDLNE